MTPSTSHRALLGRIEGRGASRLGIRTLATAAVVGGTLGLPGLLGDTPAVAAEAACDAGVTVVVDFTDFDVDGGAGVIEVGCADDDPGNGRDALAAAGFTTTDSQPGFLCAIDSRPDPCPETFDGSFWSYWHTTPDGEWTSYQVGADSSDPVPGDIEGWRYNDGTTPPGIAPGDVAGALATEQAATGSGAADESSVEDGAAPTDEGQTSAQQAQAAQNLALAVTAIGFLALIVILIAVFVVRARRRGPGNRD